MNKNHREQNLKELRILKNTLFIFKAAIFFKNKNKCAGYEQDVERINCLVTKIKNDIYKIEYLLDKDDERLLKLKQKKYSDMTSKLKKILVFISKIKDKEMKEFASSKIDDIIYKMNN